LTSTIPVAAFALTPSAVTMLVPGVIHVGAEDPLKFGMPVGLATPVPPLDRERGVVESVKLGATTVPVNVGEATGAKYNATHAVIAVNTPASTVAVMAPTPFGLITVVMVELIGSVTGIYQYLYCAEICIT